MANGNAPQRRKEKRQQQRLPLPEFNATPDTKNATDSSDYSKSEEEDNLNKWERFKNIITKSATWNMIFTGCLVVFSGLLWQANKYANETNLVTQRAFISTVGTGVLSKIQDTSHVTAYKFTVNWVNSGGTPTKVVTMQSNVAVSADAPHKGFDFDSLPQSEKTEYVFGPKAGIQSPVEFFHLSDMEALAAGRYHVFLWGWAIYHDIFGDTPVRLSEYCILAVNPRWTKPDHADPATDFAVDFSPCPTHNCYDEDCPDYAERTIGK